MSDNSPNSTPYMHFAPLLLENLPLTLHFAPLLWVIYQIDIAKYVQILTCNLILRPFLTCARGRPLVTPLVTLKGRYINFWMNEWMKSFASSVSDEWHLNCTVTKPGRIVSVGSFSVIRAELLFQDESLFTRQREGWANYVVHVFQMFGFRGLQED